MPGLNGTGPQGRGAMTGRGMGRCNDGAGTGAWFGRGMGMGRGMRRGMGRGLVSGVMPAEPAGNAGLDAVMHRLDAMQDDLDGLKQRLGAAGETDRGDAASRASEGKDGDGV